MDQGGPGPVQEEVLVEALTLECAHGRSSNDDGGAGRPLLEELAAATLESDSVSQVSRVMDQYLNFVSLEEDFFSLLLPHSYQRLHDASTPDTLIEQTVDAIVNGATPDN